MHRLIRALCLVVFLSIVVLFGGFAGIEKRDEDKVFASGSWSYVVSLSGTCEELREELPAYIISAGLIPRVQGYYDIKEWLKGMKICPLYYVGVGVEEKIVCLILVRILKWRYGIEVVCYPVWGLGLLPTLCFEKEEREDCLSRFQIDYMYQVRIYFYKISGEYKISESLYDRIFGLYPEKDLRRFRDSIEVVEERLRIKMRKTQ